MTKKIALIAGKGELPYHFHEIAVSKGYTIYPIGLFDDVNVKLQSTSNYVKMGVGELGKLLSYLIINKINSIIMLGKVEKTLIYEDVKVDETFAGLLQKLPDKKDETIIWGIMSLLKSNGIELLPQNFLMSEFLAENKNYTTSTPNDEDKKTIEIGIEAAKALGKIDVGQTVVVKDKSVVALEAVEGTNETIKRAGEYAGKGCIIVKMSRPDQDMRIDVPAVGIKTLEIAIAIKAKGIVVEADKVLVLDKEELVKKANEANIFIVGVPNN